jgi:hypothetical protein
MTFTPEQLKNWEAYEKVRLSNRYNMLDPKAQKATGLSVEEHLFCITNYNQLKAAHEAA